MRYAYASKEGIQLVIFYSAISLKGFNLPIQESFDMMLKIMELRKYFGFLFQEKHPSEFRVIINKAHIIIILANRIWSKPPHIQKNKLKMSFGHAKRFWKRKLMTVATLAGITYVTPTFCMIKHCQARNALGCIFGKFSLRKRFSQFNLA
jgi:hypothetical protein